MRVVLAGAGGLLGSAFRSQLSQDGAAVIALGRDALAIERAKEIQSTIIDSGCDLVINCAAHTDLEAAERDPGLGLAVNAVLPGILANAARDADASLLHFSSTGCYGSWQNEPYREDDPLRPMTVHHRAKRDGENAVALSNCRHLIVRTGWLFGGAPDQPKNFVWNRLLEARARIEIKSDAVQRGCPTHVGDVARESLALVRAGVNGVVNLTSTGVASRYDYVAAIVAAAKLPCRVVPGPAFDRFAPVSTNETSVNFRLMQLGWDNMPSWEQAVSDYVKTLMVSPAWRKKC